MLFPQSGNPAPVGTEIDAPERLQMLVREATCAEAPATLSGKLNGTSLSDVLSSSAGARTIFYVSPDGKDTQVASFRQQISRAATALSPALKEPVMLPVRRAAPTQSRWVKAITT